MIKRDTFYGGTIEGVKIKYDITYSSTLFELLKSYSSILLNNEKNNQLTITLSELHSVDASIQRLKSIFDSLVEWTNFIHLIPQFGLNNIVNKSLVTSNFVASLELAKNGHIEVKQDQTFGNIYVRVKQ